MRLLLFSHLQQIPEFAAYINALRKAGSIQSLLLIMGREECELAEDVGAFDEVKDILPAESELDVSDAALTNAAQALKDLEERSGSRFVHKDILMDRYFRGQPAVDLDPKKVPLTWTDSRAIQFMYIIWRRLEKEIADFNPDFVFLETNSAPYRIAWRLAREKGIPAGVFMPARVWPERVYVETGIGLDWQQARVAYNEMTDRPMKGTELNKVAQRLQTITREKAKPTYMRWKFAKGTDSLVNRLYPKRLLAGFNDWLGGRAHTYTINPRVLPGKVYSPIAKYVRYRAGLEAKRYLRQHQTHIDIIRRKKYAMYFLHYQPEITVEEMAFEYQDQVNTVRNILAALPADMSLVVKEHSPMLGRRPMDIYAKLLHMPGVILADPQEDSHKLITDASVVVTLTGTVALEAIFYGIPAIVLGCIFFDSFKGIYKPQNIYELTNLLSSPEKLLGATEEDALRALGSMRRASVPGKEARIDAKLEEFDLETAKSMMSALEKVCQESRRSDSDVS